MQVAHSHTTGHNIWSVSHHPHQQLRVVPGKTHRDLLEQEEEEEQEDRELAVVNTAVTCPRTSGTGNSW